MAFPASLTKFFQDFELSGASIIDATIDSLTGGAEDPDLAARVYAEQSGNQADLTKLEEAENAGQVIGPAAAQTAVDHFTPSLDVGVDIDAVVAKAKAIEDQAGVAEKLIIAAAVIATCVGIYRVGRDVVRLFS